MDIHYKLHKLINNDIKIYPVNRKHKFAVCIIDDRKAVYAKTKTVGEYKHTTKTINKAIKFAIDHVYNKLCNK